MEEPIAPAARPCSTPHSASLAWLHSDPPPPPALSTDAPVVSEVEGLQAAIELVLAHPEAVAEILTRGRPRPVRHDGWTGERMAAFLETLSSTGLITEACRAAGMSRDSAYALRDRDPVFAAALAAALLRARPVVADGLLERSITGTVEHFYRDGVLVGQRRHYESWLGLAVLKRLDKQAAEERAEGALSDRISGDWQVSIEGVRSGGTEALAALLEAKADKADTLPSPPGFDPWDQVWQDDSGTWLTTFPPPAGFSGYERGIPDGNNYYERACTPEECEALASHDAALQAETLAEQHHARDAWFASLRADAAAAIARAAPAAP